MFFMADINIENFYRHIGRVLSILYQAFPTKTPVYVDEVAGIDEPDEYGLHSPTYTSGFYALIWLNDEGYIRFVDTIRQDGVDQACLTHKAFIKLTQAVDPIYVDAQVEEENKVVNINKSANPSEKPPPSIIEERKLVINQLRSALRSGSSIAVNKVVLHFLHG